MAIFSKSFGKTQQKIGEVTSTIGVITSIIFGVIIILGGLGLSIYSFIPVNKNELDDNDSNNTKKKPNHILLIPGIFLIFFGIFLIFFSRWWNKFVHKNKTAAQITAIGAEANILSDILR